MRKAGWTLLVGLLTSVLIVSCGGDKGSGGSNGSGLNDLRNSPLAAQSCSQDKRAPSDAGSFAQFKQHVANCDFNQVQGNQYTFLTFTFNGKPDVVVSFAESGRTDTVTGSEFGGTMTQAQIHQSLVDLVNQGTEARKVYPEGYEFRVGSKLYLIDLTMPAEANPTSMRPYSDGSSNNYSSDGSYSLTGWY